MATGVLFEPTFLVVNDSNGAPVPGAIATFYLAGTSTPATVYADSALTTPISPVADSGGRFPPIYLTVGTNYKVLITDANGVALTGYPVDNIITPTNAAGTLTGTTLAANVVTSSLTSIGTLASLAVVGALPNSGVIPNVQIGNGATVINGNAAFRGRNINAQFDATTTTDDNPANLFMVTSGQNQTTGPQACEGYVVMTNTGAMTGKASGGLFNVEHRGTGTAFAMEGCSVGHLITNSGGGDTAYAFFASLKGRQGAGAGTVTNAYGLYIASAGAGYTNLFGIYVQDATMANFFAGDVYTAAWADYGGTSTIVGWSSFTKQNIFYKKLGRQVWVIFDLEGVSNSASVSFTLPYANAGPLLYFALGFSSDNSTAQTTSAGASFPIGSSIVTCTKDMATGTWTNVNNKGVLGQFTYQTSS